MRYEIRSWFIYMIILLILIGIASLIVVITSQEKMNPSPLAAKGVQPSASDTSAEDADRQLIHQFIFPETVSMLVNPPRDEISDLFLNPSARDNDPERLFALLLFRNFEPYPSPDEVKFSFLPSPDDQLNPKYKEAAFKKNLNIEILLDASGSMKENISTEGGPTKWETAVKEIESFVGRLPDSTHLSLRIFGHTESAEKGKNCTATELVIPFRTPNSSEVSRIMSNYQPLGDTPLAYTLMSTIHDFRGKDGRENANFIFVVTDGMETCGGDPVAAAKMLKTSEIEPFFHIVGFGVNAMEDKALRELASSVDALYERVEKLEALHTQFEELLRWAKKWEDWAKKAKKELWYERLQSTVEETDYLIKWGKAEELEVNRMRTSIDQWVASGKVDQEMEKKLTGILEERINHLHTIRERVQQDLEKRRLELYEELNRLAENPPSMEGVENNDE